jgi:hypothetical protein
VRCHLVLPILLLYGPQLAAAEPARCPFPALLADKRAPPPHPFPDMHMSEVTICYGMTGALRLLNTLCRAWFSGRAQLAALPWNGVPTSPRPVSSLPTAPPRSQPSAETSPVSFMTARSGEAGSAPAAASACRPSLPCCA